MAQAKTTDVQDGGLSDEMAPGMLAGYLGPKVRVLWNLLSAKMVAALAPFGLRTGAFSTLALLDANPGCSLTELARGLGMDKSAVVPIIDELEARGLVSRVRLPRDRRRHALTLTEEGQATARHMQGPASSVGVPIRRALSDEEMTQLLSLLDRAYRALAESPDNAAPSPGAPVSLL